MEDRKTASPLLLCILVGFSVLGVSCGGGGSSGGRSQELTLVSFNLDGTDNVPLNGVLQFTFSEPVDPASIYTVDAQGRQLGVGSIQIREGPAFGKTVEGEFEVLGATVRFAPRLPGARVEPGASTPCGLADAGLQPDAGYRITVQGYPEQRVVYGVGGGSVGTTSNHAFRTLPDDDPGFLRDHVAAALPRVTWSSPANGDAAVGVGSAMKIGDGAHARYEGAVDQIEILLSENVNPCSIDHSTVRIEVYESGDPDAGFTPVTDSAPNDPFTWGASDAVRLSPAWRVPSMLELAQSREETRLLVTPAFGRYPENALVVVRLSQGIEDFGGNPFVPHAIAFTTENLENPSGVVRFEFDASTPIDLFEKTAEVHEPKAPSKAQGFVNIAGDGDNGFDLLTPAFPASILPADCAYRDNDGADHFAPAFDTVLDTGAVENTCMNDVDGSHAVVWEFASLTIKTGITVRVVGVNPAIIRVTGPVLIQDGGELNLSGEPGARGSSSGSARGLPFPKGAQGGRGTAGGGDGGASQDVADVHPRPDDHYYGNDGWAGYGSPDYALAPEGGRGAGEGNSASGFIGPLPTMGASSGAGGGGGHAAVGTAGDMNSNLNNGWLAPKPRGAGGAGYPTGKGADMLLQPSAGSGGGAAGYCDCVATANGHHPGCTATGGGGGGGGGFIDITSNSGITVHGLIDARGGRGGGGGISFYIDIGDTGGGGGGAGGGIRLITSGEIDITGAVLTTAGGSGGTGYVSLVNGGAAPNHGGSGSPGRIALEDGDGIIRGQHSAVLVPQEGEVGFYRGSLQPSRILTSSGTTSVRTQPVFVGPLSAPRFRLPSADDFVSGISELSRLAPGATGVLLEVQGFPLLPTGAYDAAAASGWWTVGYLRDSGDPAKPAWMDGVNPTDVEVPKDNEGVGIDHIDGCGYVQLRLTFYLSPELPMGVGGAFIDRFDLRFDYQDL